MAKRTPPPGGLERNNEPAVLILTSLASREKHGYALSRIIERFAGVALGPGTLYGAITRLEERGLIEPTPSDDRRQPYRITAGGRAALSTALEQMRQLSEIGTLRLGTRVTTSGPTLGGATLGYSL